ncbi:TetR/AcrR family transcriptional regulator [Streptomyces sp. JNUCC 64]
MTPRPARKSLSRERVLAAALRLADGEGLGAVTMRRLGSSLGVEAMSLYHHLPGKEGLLDGLVEAVVAEVRSETARSAREDGDWRSELRGRCLTAREVMLRHPWAPGLIGSRRAVPVELYGYFEEVLAIMIRGGFSYRLAHRALHALGSMALGFTQELFSPAPAAGDADCGTGGDAAAEEELAAMADAFPHLTAMVSAELHEADDPTLGWCDSQTEFEFTLDLLLDGLDRARR